MDLILSEAKKRNMRVWLLDDAHFPTGYANGKIRDEHPEHGKKYLMVKTIDVDGPLDKGSFRVGDWLNRFDWMNPNEKRYHDDELHAVVASRRDPFGHGVDDTLLDLTDQVLDGQLHWDLPAGPWRIFVLIITRSHGGNPDYINIIDPKSVRVLIDAVYEPHYARYSSEFGKTFAGFFSDEPGFGNTRGFNFDESIGRKNMVLPWSLDVSTLLAGEIGPDYRRYLPCLWTDAGAKTFEIRYRFMDILTRLYAKNFVGQIGQWCEAHGVEYIGHVIEDQNVHARLGCGPGHYFRAISGQHMAGIDIIGQQVLPRYESFSDQPLRSDLDPEFFHFGLAKMGSSLGHIDPKKQGRTICEIFGASGWASGLKLNKWLIDHALVRGVNAFVPHAFSAQDFPDPDCPPHFYARGRNPQFRYFKQLMTYTNRLCHLLNGGRHVAPVAVLYHGESEWSGNYMYFQKPAHWLSRNQIDHDIIPSDVFSQPTAYNLRFDQGQLTIHHETYRALVIPYSQKITLDVARFIVSTTTSDFKVIFIDDRPDGICGVSDPEINAAWAARFAEIGVTSLSQLSDVLRSQGIYDLSLSETLPYLRYYHYQREKTHYYLFFNEHPSDSLETLVHLKEQGRVLCYDAFNNTLKPHPANQHSDGTSFGLMLSSYESALFVCAESDAELLALVPSDGPLLALKHSHQPLVLEGSWRLSMATSMDYPAFIDARELPVLTDISHPDLYPRFSGTLRYQQAFSLTAAQLDGCSSVVLDLGRVYETAEVWVNSQPMGVCISLPYRLDLTACLHPGLNSIIIDVTNTVAHEVHDPMSSSMAIEPSGLLGPVRLLLQKDY